ncbi:MAG TPA: T9SS type A sorting domain-containing protein, partial [Flavipsychrobacter sp.]|nr:T9SS type A sorting domain-containing protein [Flavipsychrobacter sp.]
ATGTGLTYQWQLNSGSGWVNLANSGVYSGAATNSLGISAAPRSMNGYQYRCMVIRACAPIATSSAATLTVDTFVTGSVSISSNDTDICAGQTANFAATPVKGGSNPAYQWQVNGVNAGTNSASFSTSALANGDTVKCIMTSGLLCASPKTLTSNGIGVTVTQNLAPAITITSDAGSDTLCSGIAAVFRASGTNGGTTPAYQWKINGINTGANFDTLWVPSLNHGDVIECELTSSLKCPLPKSVSSNQISMTIIQVVQPNVVIAASPDSVICANEEVIISCAFTNGGTTPAFQWILNGTDMPGETNDTLTTTSLNNGDDISCRFTSSEMCVSPAVSNTISFDVHPLLNPAVSVTVIYLGGNQHLFTAKPVNGGPSPVYTWYHNGILVKNGYDSTLTLPGLTPADKVWVEMASSECVPADSQVVTSNTITTGIGTTSSVFKSLELHPNPNNGIFSIQGDLAITEAREVNMSILNSLGQVIYRETIQLSAGKLNYTVNTNKDLAPGSYLLKLDYNGAKDFRQFVIVR